MAPIPNGGTVAVTGAAGFIGSWIVRLLLDRGYCVRACVRDASDEKVAFLRAMPQCTTGRLSLHSCDINQAGVFDDVFKGCHGVVHAADQLMSREHAAKDHPAAVRHSLEHIVESVNKSGTVSRLIYTSSVAAVLHESDLEEFARRPVMWDGRYPGKQQTCEKYKANLTANGYALAKLGAEAAFTEAAATSGAWDTAIVLPGDNFGPIQAAHHTTGAGGTFVSMTARALRGEKVPMLSVYHPMWAVDVRDTALAHVLLLESTAVQNGDRRLLVNGEKILSEDLLRHLSGIFPPAAGLRPTAEAVDNEPDTVKQNAAYFHKIWAGVELRNESAKALGVKFKDFQTTLRDTVESLIAVSGLSPCKL